MNIIVSSDSSDGQLSVCLRERGRGRAFERERAGIRERKREGERHIKKEERDKSNRVKETQTGHEVWLCIGWICAFIGCVTDQGEACQHSERKSYICLCTVSNCSVSAYRNIKCDSASAFGTLD